MGSTALGVNNGRLKKGECPTARCGEAAAAGPAARLPEGVPLPPARARAPSGAGPVFAGAALVAGGPAPSGPSRLLYLQRVRLHSLPSATEQYPIRPPGQRIPLGHGLRYASPNRP